MKLKEYLESLKCENVRECLVTIAGQSWQACHYFSRRTYEAGMACVSDGRHKAGETYVQEAIYCLGKLPKAYAPPDSRKQRKASVCFPAISGLEWYVTCHKQGPIEPQYQPFHPQGENFLLMPWTIEDHKIDQWEKKPYLRQSLVVSFL